MKYIYFFIFLFSLNSCSKEEIPQAVENDSGLTPLFSGTQIIRVPRYAYFTIIPPNTAEISKSVNGECSFLSSTCYEGGPGYDLMTTHPDFKWIATGSRFVVVGIFDTLPSVAQIDGFNITNPESIVWIWHTGMEGKEGDIPYEKGRKVDNGQIQTIPPGPLKLGEDYHWAIWAWDDLGNKIIYSSTVIRFIVSQSDL